MRFGKGQLVAIWTALTLYVCCTKIIFCAAVEEKNGLDVNKDGRRAKLKRVSSCKMGSSLANKIAFSRMNCATCLNLNKGSWGGDKCRFSGFPFLDQGPDTNVSPRVYNRKFLDLAQQMLTPSNVPKITKKTLTDAGLRCDDDVLKKSGLVLPKLSDAYRPDDPLSPPKVHAENFQCFKTGDQNEGNVIGEKALSSEAADENGRVALKYHISKGTKQDLVDGAYVFEAAKDPTWECEIEERVRSTWLLWRNTIVQHRNEKKRAEKKKQEEAAATKAKAQTKNATTTTASGGKQTASTAFDSIAEYFANRGPGSARNAVQIRSGRDARKATDAACTYADSVRQVVRGEYVRCLLKPGPVVEATASCRDAVVSRGASFCTKTIADFDDSQGCFWDCVDGYMNAAKMAFTPPILLN